MSIGKQILHGAVMCAALLAIGCQTTGGAMRTDSPPAAAWWYEISFEPTSSSVRGIDVGRFDPTWDRVSALEAKALEGRISAEELARYLDSELSFALKGDLDDDGTPEDVFVGVFSTRNGERGRFVVITRNGQLLQHFAQTGAAGFSALLKYEDGVRWYKCMECGEFELIGWSGQSFFLE
ncbi:MAG: hypothetical protein ACREPV_06770 [Lysobacter sp.]